MVVRISCVVLAIAAWCEGLAPLRGGGGLEACGAPSADDGGGVASRREAFRQVAALGGSLSTVALGMPATVCRGIADDSPAPDATFVRVAYGPGSVEMPSTWKRDGPRVADPVLGSISDSIAAHSVATDKAAMADFGKIEKVPLANLGLASGREKGDFVGAKTRQALDGKLYYEWDLAVPPPNGCPRSEQEVIVCPPVEVALISATIDDGKLVVFECGVGKVQWKNFGRQLRTMRSTFSTTEPTSA